MVVELSQENIWFDKWRYDDAERQYQESLGTEDLLIPLKVEINSVEEELQLNSPINTDTSVVKPLDMISVTDSTTTVEHHSVVHDNHEKPTEEKEMSIVKGQDVSSVATTDLINRVTKLEIEKKSLQSTVSKLEKSIIDLTNRLAAIEVNKTTTTVPSKVVTKPEPLDEDDDDDDDVDLFGSDDEEEDAEAARVRDERLKAYADKKSTKPGPIAKSSVLLDCKPWEDTTDMKMMEEAIRAISMDGLLWGASKLVPLAYGIMKLSMLCTVEDEKVSIDDLIERICENEDYVQSVDIAAFNKI